VQRVEKPSYFWSDRYGARIQFAGAAEPSDEVSFVDGAPTEESSSRPTSRGRHDRGAGDEVLAMNSPRLFTRRRRQLAGMSHVA
jgi:hypothetical protein